MIYIFTLILLVTLIALSVIDVRRFVLPDLLTLPLIAFGLLQAFVLSPVHLGGQMGSLMSSGLNSLIGAILGYASFVLIEVSFKALRGKDGLGRGDAKLIAAGGAWCGWAGLPFIVLIASAAALCTLVIPSFRKKAGTGHIPFGPFLAFAIFCVWAANILVAGGFTA